MFKRSGRSAFASLRRSTSAGVAAILLDSPKRAQTIDRPSKMCPGRGFRFARLSSQDGVGDASIVTAPPCLVRFQHRAELDADEVYPHRRQHAAKLQIGCHRCDRTVETVPRYTEVRAGGFSIE